MSEKFDRTQSESAGKRARDADREQVMALLDGALADGQLDGFEHRDRVARALRSTTLGELGATLDDLQVPTPAFLLPAPLPAPAPARTTAPQPSALTRPAPAAPPAPQARRASPQPGPQSADTSDQKVKTIASAIGAVAFAVVAIAVLTNASSTSSPKNDYKSPWGGSSVTFCDANGQHCKDGNGNPKPDLPRDRAAVEGVTLLGNPTASTNVRKAYESAVAALKPTSIVSFAVRGGAVEAVVFQSDSELQSRRWTLSDGKWRSTTGDDRQGQPGFAPGAMNLDRITAAIAEAPGIQRSAREPTQVEFSATAVTITYRGQSESVYPTLVLAPDGTVVA